MLRTDMNYTWPTAEVAVMGADGAANIIFRGQDNLDELKADYVDRFANPLVAAQRGYIEDVIQPSTTRRRICEDLDFLENKEELEPWKKHGNIPL